jgi:HNH endonuclease
MIAAISRDGRWPRLPFALRFWSKVSKGTDAVCWEWNGKTGRNGYGYIKAARTEHYHLAHRVAWALTYGPIPHRLQVLHHCDTPRCVNPAHLFLGTQADNMTDKAKKGRAPALPPERARMLARLGGLASTGKLSPAARTRRALRGWTTRRARRLVQ